MSRTLVIEGVTYNFTGAVAGLSDERLRGIAAGVRRIDARPVVLEHGTVTYAMEPNDSDAIRAARERQTKRGQLSDEERAKLYASANSTTGQEPATNDPIAAAKERQRRRGLATEGAQ